MKKQKSLTAQGTDALMECFERLDGGNLSHKDLANLIARAYLAGKATGLGTAMARLQMPGIATTPETQAACRKISDMCRAAGERCFNSTDVETP